MYKKWNSQSACRSKLALSELESVAYDIIIRPRYGYSYSAGKLALCIFNITQTSYGNA